LIKKTARKLEIMRLEETRNKVRLLHTVSSLKDEQIRVEDERNARSSVRGELCPAESVEEP
jgi:hypothetical protein